ncbi:MAG: outer membrane beta-barrel protein [Cytophagaceae bacterium]|nr:outer membrane beta-barrel protein [Cytophagaceae bacterium]
MENKEDDIEHLFQERFANDEVPLSPRVWQNIKKALPEDKSPTGFMFSQNIVLWSISGILVVSAVIGCFLFGAPKNSTPSIAFVQQEQKSSVKKTNDYSTVATDRNNQLNKTSGKDLPHDSFSTPHSGAQASNQMNISEKSMDDVHHLSTSKNKTTHANNSHPYDSSHSNFHTNHTIIIKSTNRENSTITNESSALRKLDSKKTNKQTVVSNPTRILYKQKNKRDGSQNGKTKTTHNLSVSQSSKSYDALHSSKDHKANKLHSTDLAGSKTRTAIDSTLRQKSENEKTTFVNNNSSLTEADTAVHKSYETPSFDKTNVAKQNTTDTILHSSRNQPIIFNPSSTISSDSSLVNKSTVSTTTIFPDNQKDSLENTNDSSAPLANASDREKDRLKHTSLISSTVSNNTPLDSSALKNNSNDSLSSVYVASNHSVLDSLALLIDSTENITKDSTLAEESTKKEKSKSNLLNRFSFDIVATALLTGASTKSTATDSLTQSAVEDKNRNDKNSIGYSAGIAVNYKLNDRFQTSAGILYTVFSEQYNFNYTLKTFDYVYLDSSWQYVEKDSISRDIKSKDQYSFLSIPLQLSYTFLAKQKIRLSATAGIRSNILLKGVTYLANANKSDVLELKSFNSISFSYLFALEASYKLNVHTALLLQPTFVYAASSIHNKTSGLIQKPYGVGLTIGLRVNF